MHFEMEELVPIVAKLAGEYTSFESTSIPYEKAQQLMEAVLYCIHEAELVEAAENVSAAEDVGETRSHLPVSKEKTSARQAYHTGKNCVEQKTKQALNLYHAILPEFVSCGNRCLYETFTKGLPEFFRWYDVKFAPQNTIVTLDYPILKDISGLTGIDKIYEFLQCISLEQKFLQKFPEEYVTEILEQYAKKVSGAQDTGRELAENICDCDYSPFHCHASYYLLSMFVSFGSSCLLYHLPVPYIILIAIRLSMSFEIFLSVTSAYRWVVLIPE